MLTRRALLALAPAALALRPSVAAPAQRVVSVGGSLTEVVYALGAEASLVGVDSTSVYPAIARSLPDVGYMRTLSTEGLLALAPTLILATEDAGPPAVLRQLELAKVPLHILRSEHRFEGLLARIDRVGELLGRTTQARALVERLCAEWASSQQRVQQLSQASKPPRVLFVLAHSLAQLRIAGEGTAADAMLGYAGVRNALSGVSGYKQLTPEAAIAAAPDVILTTSEGLQAAGGIAPLLQAPGLAMTPAGRARRVVAFDALALLGFGPRLPQLLPKLAESLHQA
ncbi:ABC transporter substrate-binding protein [Pelomonas sp. V22]|uniref:heme/hemin ABC transporter substrate-binding protein n=1 Tax=Pelomonas sp. V22 TaxID=2822139 RepID=UPI0024A93305|nr:ABC transporter substrate-binding protein [Pelomonas sp. V22]MDI4632462.1 ABC transporter substrate-binding protein [Pelomonas sp. V22]